MNLKRNDKVMFEKFGEGTVENIQSTLSRKQRYNYIKFLFDSGETTVILPELELKNYKWYKLKEAGQSLIGVMVSLAVFSIMSLMMLQVVNIMNKNMRALQAIGDVSVYAGQLRNSLTSASGSTTALAGNDVTSANILLKDAGGAVIASNGQGWSVSSFRLVNIITLPQQTDYYKLTLVMNVNLDSGLQLRTRQIADIYCTVKNNTVHNCYGTTDLFAIIESNCLGLGGDWKGGNAFGAQCVINNGHNQ